MTYPGAGLAILPECPSLANAADAKRVLAELRGRRPMSDGQTSVKVVHRH